MNRFAPLALIAAALVACDEQPAHQVAAPLTPAPQPAEAPAVEAPAPAATPTSSSEAEEQAYFAALTEKFHHFSPWIAPAFDVEVEGSGLRFDLLRGDGVLSEEDARFGEIVIRRERHLGLGGASALGWGWRMEFEGYLSTQGEFVDVLGLHGFERFVASGRGEWRPLVGRPQLLRRTATGYELRDVNGERWRYNAAGELVETPNYRIGWKEDQVILSNGGVRVEIDVDEDGLIREIRSGDRTLRYDYVDDYLVDVSGPTPRGYDYVGDALERVYVGGEAVMTFTHDARGRLATVETAEETRRYEATGDSLVERVAVTSSEGRTELRYRETAVVVTTVAGDEVVELGARFLPTVASRHLFVPGHLDGLERDAEGRVAGGVDAEGRAVGLEWEGERLAARIDAAGTTQFERRGSTVTVRTPEGRAWHVEQGAEGVTGWEGPMGWVRWERDAAGRRVARTDATGAEVRFTYDGAGQLVEERAGDWARQLDYDAAGRLAAVEVGESHERFERNGAGQLTAVVSDGIRYTIEQRGDAQRVRTPWGALIARSEGAGRRSLETEAGTFRFAQRDDEVVVRYPNGQTDRWGNASEAEYDEAGRLVGWGEEGFGYDRDGNRVRVGGETAEFDGRGRLVRQGGEVFGYDGAGRLVERVGEAGTTRYRYDVLGRLIEVEGPGVRAAYRYDALGRVSARRTAEGVTRYAYLGDRLIAERGPAGERVYLWAPGVDQPLAYRADGRWIYLHGEGRGRVATYRDAEGRVLGRAELTAFGEVVRAPAGAPVFFGGRKIDEETGLVDMRARTYDPTTGRFLTPDPSGLRGGINGYAYAGGDPIHRVDPLGLFYEDVRGAVLRTLFGGQTHDTSHFRNLGDPVEHLRSLTATFASTGSLDVASLEGDDFDFVYHLINNPEYLLSEFPEQDFEDLSTALRGLPQDLIAQVDAHGKLGQLVDTIETAHKAHTAASAATQGDRIREDAAYAARRAEAERTLGNAALELSGAADVGRTLQAARAEGASGNVVGGAALLAIAGIQTVDAFNPVSKATRGAQVVGRVVRNTARTGVTRASVSRSLRTLQRHQRQAARAADRAVAGTQAGRRLSQGQDAAERTQDALGHAENAQELLDGDDDADADREAATGLVEALAGAAQGRLSARR